MRVLTGEKVAIGGFIITGTAPKRVLVRALGPSLAKFGISDVLADPTITLHGSADFAPVVNDNWTSSQRTEIETSGLAPGSDGESAIVATLAPGSYTAVLSGTNGTTGTGIIEIYDLDFTAPSKLANISTRAFVGSGDDMLIAGFIVGSADGGDTIIVRGLGPSLTRDPVNASEQVRDPTLEVRDAEGAILAANDNYWQSPDRDQVASAGLAPDYSNECAVAITLKPGAYTALLAPSSNPFSTTQPGLGLVEVYSLGRLA